jgi:hypothetical protein
VNTGESKIKSKIKIKKEKGSGRMEVKGTAITPVSSRLQGGEREKQSSCLATWLLGSGMRIVIALLFLAAVFVCTFTSNLAVDGIQLISTNGIGDPEHLSVKLKESLTLQAMGTSLGAVALLLMAVHAFSQRAVVKGIMIALFSILAGAIAAIAVLDVGAVSKAATSVKPETYSEYKAAATHYQRPTWLGRMSLELGTVRGLAQILATAQMRVMSTLCVLSLGVALTLLVGRAPHHRADTPPPIPR